ncbi:MAG: hypothetical protein PVSMB1_12230 [Gemmatimonadaceae bacterium]
MGAHAPRGRDHNIASLRVLVEGGPDDVRKRPSGSTVFDGDATITSLVAATHGYVEADLAMKERALANLTPAGATARRFKANDSLMTFLATT